MHHGGAERKAHLGAGHAHVQELVVAPQPKHLARLARHVARRRHLEPPARLQPLQHRQRARHPVRGPAHKVAAGAQPAPHD